MEDVSPRPDVLTVLAMPYFKAASCFLFFSARDAAVVSAGCEADGVGGGDRTGAGDGLSIFGEPPKHISAPLFGMSVCHNCEQ